MVFVFGIDIPLMEMLFVMSILLVFLFIFHVIVIVRQGRIYESLQRLLDKESSHAREIGKTAGMIEKLNVVKKTVTQTSNTNRRKSRRKPVKKKVAPKKKAAPKKTVKHKPVKKKPVRKKRMQTKTVTTKKKYSVTS